MNSTVQDKIKLYQEMARKNGNVSSVKSTHVADSSVGLLKAIRSKDDADRFIAELNAAIEQSK